jgi:DNA-directed DNA polymerase III PolC
VEGGSHFEMDTFVHLEVQSSFSFLWGTFTPERLVQRVTALGQTAVALTDSTLHGAVRFYRAATEAGVQPLVGIKVSIWDGSSVILLARDFNGYGNLCRLLSIAIDGGITPKNLLTKQDLAHWSRGVVCLVGGWKSRIRSALVKGRVDAARMSLAELRGLLHNPEHLFLILQNHGKSEAEIREALQVMRSATELASSLSIPVVATNEVAYLQPQDYILHRTVVGIQREHHHRQVHPLPNDTFFLASSEEMQRKIPYSEAIRNTSYIASLCKQFSLPIGKLHPPSLQKPEDATGNLTNLCFREAAKLLQPLPVEYLRQLDHELALISHLKMADLFLLARDIIDFAREKGIRSSVRGSAAGSLVVHLALGGVDPISNDLLFERFMNEGRADMPDIDIDFDSERRDEVLRYVLNRFPRQACMVATILSFKARSAVRLTARALGYPLREIDRLATCLPWSLRGGNLETALERLPELRNTPLKDESRLVELAARLVGLPHQASTHLGGVLLTPGHIKDWTPVGLSPQGLPVGQLDKDDIDALGLLKMDILGLRMHTALRKALQVLWRQGVSINLGRLPLDDAKTYGLLRSTDTVGIFQLESPGQRNLVARLLPTHFGDLIAEISLFRPGPVEGDMVENFVRRRNGQEPVQIQHPDLEPALKETYGVILYQEQVLRIANTFAGFSFSEADKFRRAMTRDRSYQFMDSLKQKFIEGAMAKGHSQRMAESVFKRVAAFAAFGFCKAHAASFAHICYQSAFLKAHYPRAFYVGLLNAGHVGSYPAWVILNEARRRGIPIYCPHVNSSGREYCLERAGIRVPLSVIAGVGPETSRRIVAEREKRGLFSSVQDFLDRFSPPDKILEILSATGALDGLDAEWTMSREVCYACL